jgi:hypothetical protein
MAPDWLLRQCLIGEAVDLYLIEGLILFAKPYRTCLPAPKATEEQDKQLCSLCDMVQEAAVANEFLIRHVWVDGPHTAMRKLHRDMADPNPADFSYQTVLSHAVNIFNCRYKEKEEHNQ